MNGAYCLDCREAGPDLVVDVDTPGLALDVDERPPLGLVAHLVLTCTRCRTRWFWYVRFERDRVLYGPATRLGTDEGQEPRLHFAPDPDEDHD
jgi:hypothetical protein